MVDKIAYEKFRKGNLSGAVRSGHLADFLETVASYGGDRFIWCKDRPKIGAGVVNGYFIKCYHYNGIISEIRHIFRPSRARHCVRCAENLLNLQIATPAVLGFCRKSRFALPLCDYLVTDALGDEFVFFDKIYPAEPEWTAKELASLAWKLHSSGILHGDLNLRNLYCTPEKCCGIIDLDGCRLLLEVPSPALRRREVARLISSALKTLPKEKRNLERCAKLFCSAYRACGGENFYGAALFEDTAYLLNRRR